jgi:hypothetical protein
MTFYQKALSKVIKKSPTVDIEDAKATAAWWNTMGPLPEIQAKYQRNIYIPDAITDRLSCRTAHKHGTKYIRDFCRQMKVSCGMDCLVIGFYQDGDQNIVLQSYVTAYPNSSLKVTTMG